ncbi:MAG: hypothetical protein GWP14_03955 [Actinobacteria bacterium]|nr:hypothetical protein [Actinomycetota bacterium]
MKGKDRNELMRVRGRPLGISLFVQGIVLMCLAHCESVVYAEPDDSGPLAKDEEAFTLEELGTSATLPAGVQASADKEQSFLDRLGENLRFNTDVISRVWTTHRRGQGSWFNAVGFDIHKVFSDNNGDIGTLLLQPFIVRRDNVIPIPHHVEDDDDWELELHDFYFNLRRWGQGRSNFKIGHFDVPYGLEETVDTHMVLHQVISHQNIGLKKDWGFSVNGQLPSFDYEVSLTRGSGMEYIDKGKNYAVTGRIGTPSDRNFVLGLSGFYGEILGHQGNLMRRFRTGLDVTWIVRQFTFRSEVSFGQDFDDDVFNALAELNWSSADEKLQFYVQGIYLGSEKTGSWDEEVDCRVGALVQISERLAISGQYSQDLRSPGRNPEDAMFSLQLRFYY